jgi:hypothetical protein
MELRKDEQIGIWAEKQENKTTIRKTYVDWRVI